MYVECYGMTLSTYKKNQLTTASYILHFIPIKIEEHVTKISLYL